MNVTYAAVSKWERGETYPDITLLQPLAYFFEVTLDELMGYDQKKVQADIDETIALYRKHWKDSGVWIQHNKTNHNFIIVNEKGFSLRIGKIRIKISVMIISLFVHVVRIVLCHLIQIFLIYIP